MLFNDTDMMVFKYVKENPSQSTTQIIKALAMKEGTVRSVLRRRKDCFDLERKNLGDNGGYAFFYSVKKDLPTPTTNMGRIEPKKLRIKHHPIMRALYGL